MNDSEVMLLALSKERELLHEQLMQVDRIIKRVKTGEYLSSDNVTQINLMPVKAIEQAANTAFPVQANIKVQVLKVFDLISHAAKLSEIQKKFTELTGKDYNIRDIARVMNKNRLLLMIKEKDKGRSVLWIKKDWIENNELMDKHKPDGFDMLYRADNLEFI